MKVRDKHETMTENGSAEDVIGSNAINLQKADKNAPTISLSSWYTVGVLCSLFLINNLDRFTIAGVLGNIQKDFQIGDDKSGLLQTSFILSFMICSPIFGYFGDRYSRKWLMILGLSFFGLTLVVSSFMSGYYSFLAVRALAGVGEASFSTSAPAIISDLFLDNKRTRMLALYNFFNPVGAGLGYIYSAGITDLLGSWRWPFRTTAMLCVISVILLFFIEDPVRGKNEGAQNLKATSYKEDLKDLISNRSYMTQLIGLTFVIFVTSGLTWWGPTFISFGFSLNPATEDITLTDIAYVFGLLALASGFVGVPMGSFLSILFKKRCKRIDPIICTVGVFCGALLILAAMFSVNNDMIATYVCIFFGVLLINMIWAVRADIALYIIVPTRRSTADAFLTFSTNAFGVALSPFLIGVISEAFKTNLRENSKSANGFNPVVLNSIESLKNTTTQLIENSNEIKFYALQYSLFLTIIFLIIGSFFFLLTIFFVVKDRSKAAKFVADSKVKEMSP